MIALLRKRGNPLPVFAIDNVSYDTFIIAYGGTYWARLQIVRDEKGEHYLDFVESNIFVTTKAKDLR